MKLEIAFALREEYKEKIDKLRSNYRRKSGKPFSFSGMINLLLKYGFKFFEKKHRIKIEDLRINQEKIEE